MVDDDIIYDEATQMVTLSDGTKLTMEQYQLLARSLTPTGRTPSSPLMQGGRRAGATSRAFERDLKIFKNAHLGRGTVDKAHLAYLLERSPHRVVVWVSKRRYTYVAVNAGDWYISGTGDWYGRNQFTPDEFIDDVVTHDEVTAIYLVTELETLWSR